MSTPLRVRALDSHGDWTWGKGRNNYKIQNAMVAQNLQTRLLCQLGDCFFDLPSGIDWFNLMGGKDLVQFALDVKTIILNTNYVTGIIELSANLDNTRKRTLSYRVSTVFGDIIKGQVGFLTDESGRILTTESGVPISG